MAKSAKKTYLHILIAVIIFAVLKLAVPAANGLTPVGVNVIAIFIPVLYLWLTVSTDWVSWVALGLLIMTGIMTPADIYAGTFGSALIITVIAMMAFSKVLTDTGVIGTLVKWMMTREIVRNRPYVFMTMIFVACAIVSMFVDIGAVSLIFISMIAVVCEQIGYKKGDPFYTALMLGIFWITNAFNGGSPLGHALPVIMMNSAAASGVEISYAQWMSIGVPFAIITTIVCILIICVIWRPEASKFRNYDLDSARKEVQPLTKQGIISIIVFLAVILYWVLPEVVPGIFPAEALAMIKTWGTTLPLMFALALLCVIHVGKKPITTFPVLTSTSTVTVLLFIGAVTILGNAVSSADSGISACLGNILSPITANMSPFVLVLVVALGTIVLTNFISNTVCMLLFYSISVPIMASMGQPVVGLTVIIGVTACFASLVPSAAVTAPFFFGPEHITVKNAFKWNVIAIVLAWAIAVFLIYPLSTVIAG